jgi:transposase-like protein
MPKKYPPEFKRDVAEVARRGDLTFAEVASDFGVSPESVRLVAAQGRAIGASRSKRALTPNFVVAGFGRQSIFAGRTYVW